MAGRHQPAAVLAGAGSGQDRGWLCYDVSCGCVCRDAAVLAGARSGQDRGWLCNGVPYDDVYCVGSIPSCVSYDGVGGIPSGLPYDGVYGVGGIPSGVSYDGVPYDGVSCVPSAVSDVSDDYLPDHYLADGGGGRCSQQCPGPRREGWCLVLWRV